MKPEKLSLRQILSVRCPMCGAAPKQKCALSTGHPSSKTHLDRELAAAKGSCSEENAGQAIVRILKAATSGLRVLFQQK